MNDVQAIRLAKTELREAYRTRDLNRAIAVFSENYSDLSAGNASFWGAEAKAVLRHRLQQLFTRYRPTLAVTIISIAIGGNLAFDWGWHKLTFVGKKGKRKISKRTRYLEIWQKEADGQWRIAIFIDNADVKPQMPPASVLRIMRGEVKPKSKKQK